MLTEVADALAIPELRGLASRLIRGILTDPAVTVIPAAQEWFDRGLSLYESRSDKRWSLTDCISFVVMQQHDLTEALTGDRHFEQAGFRTLLANTH